MSRVLKEGPPRARYEIPKTEEICSQVDRLEKPEVKDDQTESRLDMADNDTVVNNRVSVMDAE